MAQPRTRFNRPFSYRAAASVPQNQVQIIEPVLGFDRSQPAVDLQPGQTPDSTNFVVEDGFLTPRSGLSIFGPSNTSLGDIGLAVTEHHDVDGNRYPIVVSGSTIVYFANLSWSTLSYVVRGAGAPADQWSGTSRDNVFATSVYEPNADQNWFVFSNGRNVPKVWIPSNTTYSDLSDFLSVESVGKIPYGIDDRLCFFGCGDSDTTFATRVRWSERGNTSKFSTYAAGFQDLMDMKGIGTGVSVREFDALLFSTQEIWVQRPRRDNFAFDFVPLERSLGCPFPKTIAETPQGTIFLTRELEPYIISGTQISPIGKPVHQFLRGDMRNVDFSFGLYNSKRQRYEFYYDSSSSGGRPHKGLYLDMDSGAWMPIDLYGLEIGAGSDVGADLGADIIWDNIELTWDEIDAAWNDMVTSTSKDKDVMVVSSGGTVYRFRDEQGSDDGSTITAQWSSHALSGEDPTRKLSMYEQFIEYKAGDSGSYVVETRAAPSGGYGESRTLTYTATDSAKAHNVPFITGDHPQFRITVNDGKRPRFARLIVKLRDAGQY